jgi:VanZ family protein
LSRRIVLWGPVAVAMAAIFYASLQPDVSLPQGIDDKPTHSAGYMVLGLLVVRALAGGFGARVGAAAAVTGIAIASAHGAVAEVLQMYVPGRYADWNDLAADAIGAALGAVAGWLWGIIRQSRAAARDTPRHGL